MFDYIIVGAGSSGCVLAARLSENPFVKVALIEAGGSDDSVLIQTPAGLAANVIRQNANNWFYHTTPQPGLNHRQGYQPRGKVLGGSSSINAMIYARGHAHDYDEWAAMGNEGWGWKDVLPYFRLSQNQERGESELHGIGGPLNVADLRTDNPIAHAFIKAAKNLGYPENNDFNGQQQEGVGFYQVTQKSGERHSAAKAYLKKVSSRSNLTVLTNTQVLEILFTGSRATGVLCLHNGQKTTLTADKEIILSGGAFNSPQLLMLSGIGPEQELKKHGIHVRKNLPGVGKNLQDHIDYVFAFKSDSRELFGLSLTGGLRILKEIKKYRHYRQGMLTSNIAEAGGFLKTSPELSRPDIQLHFVVALLDDHGRKIHAGHGYSCHVCLLRPKSRGSLTLASADPLASPLIDPAFLTDPDDIELLKQAYRQTSEILQEKALQPYRGKELYSVDINDDRQIENLLRQRSDSVYHPIGTCRMGRDEYAVVDSELRVHGVEGLRVVDASVMPTLIGGNISAPCVMIGEKAADLIQGRTMLYTPVLTEVADMVGQ